MPAVASPPPSTRGGWIEYALLNNGGAYFFWNAHSPAEGSWTLASDPPDTSSLDYIFELGLRADGTGMVVLSRGSLEAESSDPNVKPFIISTPRSKPMRWWGRRAAPP